MFIFLRNLCCGLTQSINRILPDRVISLSLTIGLKEGFWTEAFSLTIFLINRTHSVIIDMKITTKTWKCFMLKCLVVQLMYMMTGLINRTLRGILLGYTEVRQYMLCLAVEKIMISRHVEFDKTIYWMWSLNLIIASRGYRSIKHI